MSEINNDDVRIDFERIKSGEYPLDEAVVFYSRALATRAATIAALTKERDDWKRLYEKARDRVMYLEDVEKGRQEQIRREKAEEDWG